MIPIHEPMSPQPYWVCVCVLVGEPWDASFELERLAAPMEACCMPNGDCSLAPPDSCGIAGGAPQGSGTDCDPNPCPPPTATRDLSWGGVKALFRD